MTPRRSARIAPAIIAFAMVALGALFGLFATLTTAAPAAAAACDTARGVTVVVDFNELGGGVKSVCLPDGGGKNAADLFPAAGFEITYTERNDFVCRVASEPTGRPCRYHTPRNEYWSLWQSKGSPGSEWVHTSARVTTITVPDGAMVAFSWDEQPGPEAPSAPSDRNETSAGPTSSAPPPAPAPPPGGGAPPGGESTTPEPEAPEPETTEPTPTVPEPSSTPDPNRTPDPEPTTDSPSAEPTDAEPTDAAPTAPATPSPAAPPATPPTTPAAPATSPSHTPTDQAPLPNVQDPVTPQVPTEPGTTTTTEADRVPQGLPEWVHPVAVALLIVAAGGVVVWKFQTL